MGGFGSGRRGNRLNAEACLTLDVNALHRQGCLKAGWRGNLRWTRDRELRAMVGLHTEQRRAVLDYRVRKTGGDWTDVKQAIQIGDVACHFGGHRPFFICPGFAKGNHCKRRVAKLFLGGPQFLCRHCSRLAYASQSEQRHDRLLRRADKLRKALGSAPGTMLCFVQKPKGMWNETFQSLCQRIDDLEQRAEFEFVQNHPNPFARWADSSDQECE